MEKRREERMVDTRLEGVPRETRKTSEQQRALKIHQGGSCNVGCRRERGDGMSVFACCEFRNAVRTPRG